MGFFLFLILFILVLGLAIVGSVLNFFLRLFSFGKKQTSTAQQGGESSSKRSSKKVFGREEGEYIDFEEVKN